MAACGRIYVRATLRALPAPARIRTQLRAPFSKLRMLYFSFGEWMRSSSRPKPISRLSMPSASRNDETIGIDAPHAHQHGGFAPLLFERLGGGLHRRVAGVEADGRRSRMMAEPRRRAIGGQDCSST